MGKENSGQRATEEIRSSIRLLNLLGFFMIFTLLFVIFRYLFKPVHQMLSFLPDASIAVILIAVIGLALAGVFFSGTLSRKIVRRIEDHNKRLDSILAFTREIKEEIYGDILLDKVLNCAMTLTGSDAGSILLKDDDKLVFKIVKGLKAQMLAGKTIAKDDGIAGWVSEHGESVLTGDAKKDERFDPAIAAFTGYEPASLLCVPLRTKTATLGVVELMNRKKEFYSNRDIDMISYLADQAAISIERTRFYDDQRNYEIHLTDMLLDAIDRFMAEKRGHSRRVAQYANIIAKALDMTESKKRRLYFASLLHDIGFLRIPVESSFEKESFTMHPLIGYEMLNPITFYKDICSYVLYHHERYDGTGYPEGLKGTDIPLESRIIAIAEAFDSMVSKVSYRVSVNFDVAIDELLKNKGSQFDAELVDLFVRDIRKPLA